MKKSSKTPEECQLKLLRSSFTERMAHFNPRIPSVLRFTEKAVFRKTSRLVNANLPPV